MLVALVDSTTSPKSTPMLRPSKLEISTRVGRALEPDSAAAATFNISAGGWVRIVGGIFDVFVSITGFKV